MNNEINNDIISLKGVVIINYILKKHKKVITIATIILFIICGMVYKNTVFDTQVVVIESEQPQTNTEKKEEIKVENPNITVYVCGSVKKSVNVTLPKDSRVEDAIRLAGGTAADADLNGINMAQKLSDEDMVYVPKKGEIIENGGKNSIVTPSPAKKGKLNINRATAQQLDTLPGIGPAIADRIIEYRNSIGSFKSIEELRNVSGIADEKYMDIKGLITVD